MSRKSKIICYTIKSNTIPVKPKDPIKARPEQLNMDKPEDNDLKITSKECFKFLKMK